MDDCNPNPRDGSLVEAMQSWFGDPTHDNLRALMRCAREWRDSNRRGAELVRRIDGSIKQRHFREQLREHVRAALDIGEEDGAKPARDDVLVHGMYDLLDLFDELSPSRGFTVDEMVDRHRAREANPQRDSWVVDRLLRAGGVGLALGDPKSGKSALARCTAMAVSGGEDMYLGRRVANGPCIFVELDEPEASVGEHYAEIQIPGAALHHYQDHGGCSLPSRPFEWLDEWARDIGAVLICIDTAFRFLPIGGDNAISDYGAMTAAMSKFQRLAEQTDAHVLLLHHVAKGDGQRSALGSQAIGGAVDTLVMVTNDADGTRYVQADGRGVSMPKARLEYEDGWVSLGISAKAEAARDKRAELMAVIEARPGDLSRSEAVKAAGVRKDEGLQLLGIMEREGYIRAAACDGRRGLTLWPVDTAVPSSRAIDEEPGTVQTRK